jgi:hypothetical protein
MCRFVQGTCCTAPGDTEIDPLDTVRLQQTQGQLHQSLKGIKIYE